MTPLLQRVAALVGGAGTDAAVDLAYAGGWRAVRALPEPVAVRLFDLGADLAARRGGPGVERLRANLARVAPGRDLTHQALRSYARYWREVFRLPGTPPQVIRERMELERAQEFLTVTSQRRPTILALPHSGNWDHAGAWCVLQGLPFTTVAERLRPESLFDRFVAFRTGLGMEVLPLTGGDRPPFEVLEQRLRESRMLCLLADRDLSARGVDVRFFGAATRMPAGPASLALRTGAVLLPVVLSFTDAGWRARFSPAVAHTDVATMTQALADAFAEGIARTPQDWHMLQRLWLQDLAADDPRRGPR